MEGSVVIQMRGDFAFIMLMMMVEGNGWTQQPFICAACMEVRVKVKQNCSRENSMDLV